MRGDFLHASTSKRLRVDILPQPNDTTCGPTCLHAIYRYWGDRIKLNAVIEEVPALAEGGTLAVFLAGHALRRGYNAKIWTYNLHVFDPTWFGQGAGHLERKLRAQMAVKTDPKLQLATLGYLDFLDQGGSIAFEDLKPNLILEHLSAGRPILTGLSATWLYRTAREIGATNKAHDTAGDPTGHFVVLSGWNHRTNSVLVADPYRTNPAFGDQYYEVAFDRLITAILLGVVTYDANLLLITPSEDKKVSVTRRKGGERQKTSARKQTPKRQNKTRRRKSSHV